MDYSLGYSASYRLMRVDADTWGDTVEIHRVTSISLTSAIDSQAPSIDSGTIDFDSAYPGDGYVRVWVDAEQSGVLSRVPLGTYFMTESDGAPPDGGSEASLLSVLYPASNETMPTGTTCRIGQDGAARAASLLSDSCVCPVSVTESYYRENDIVSEKDETVLSFSWALLSKSDEESSSKSAIADAPTCLITIDGWGRVTVGPKDTSRVVIPSSHIIDSISTSRNNDGNAQLDYHRELIGLRVGGIAVIDGSEYRVTQQSIECGCGVNVSETAVKM